MSLHVAITRIATIQQPDPTTQMPLAGDVPASAVRQWNVAALLLGSFTGSHLEADAINESVTPLLPPLAALHKEATALIRRGRSWSPSCATQMLTSQHRKHLIQQYSLVNTG